MKNITLAKITILFFTLFISACATYPDVVSVAENTQLVNFETVNQVDVNKIGETARWSGVIADIKNKKKITKLDVLYYPSMSDGRPNTSKPPIGRFRANVDQFLDPAIYKKGKQITALGTLKAKETAKIDEYEYEYPTINNAKVYLWPKVKPLPQFQYYYGWHGIHPRWYWHGGKRYMYMPSDPKKRPTAQSKKSEPVN